MARKYEFNTGIINDMKKAAEDSFADNIKMLPIEQLHDSEQNFYDLSALEILAEDIDRQGLKTPLYVIPADEGYTIISGHRRKAAVQMLIDDGKYTGGKLPCYIGTPKKSAAEMKLDLIMLNATARVISDAESVRQHQELEDCFKQLEAEGKKFSGRMREKIAAIMQVSPSQVGKIENIRNNAIPAIQKAVENGKMSISTANEAAKLNPVEQQDLIERKKPEEITHKEVKEVHRQEQQKEDVPNSAPSPEIKSVNTEDTSFTEETTPTYDEIAQKARKAAALWCNPPEYFDEIIDSGMCNSIISGYILLALDKLEIQLTEQQRGDFNHIMNRIFDSADAQQARNRYKSN